MSDKVPDPLEDPEGYGLWCESHACETCDGEGGWEDEAGRFHECRACGGSGLDYCDGLDDE